MVVETAALLYLPVHAEGLCVMPLDAVHAEIMVAGVGVLCVDQGQGDEVAAVLGPGFKKRQSREVGWRLHVLGDGPFGTAFHAELECGRDQVFVWPEFARRERGQVLG